MKIEALHLGMRVRHPQYGTGAVKTIAEATAEIQFDNGIRRTIAPEPSGLEPAEPQAAITSLEVPLTLLVKQTVDATLDKLGLSHPEDEVKQLGRWLNGKVVLHPSDPAAQAKEIPIATFFHKIVMMRNQLRVLEQKINGHEQLSDAEKIDMQQYITRCYGSMTTFNVFFKEKEDQF